jgi:hypothetical protein
VRARGKYTLLILDGYDSHVTQALIGYAHASKILLLMFPPHATHALQPLDVACYRLLVQAAKRAEIDARKEEAIRKSNAKKSAQLPKQAKSKTLQKSQSKVT